VRALAARYWSTFLNATLSIRAVASPPISAWRSIAPTICGQPVLRVLSAWLGEISAALRDLHARAHAHTLQPGRVARQHLHRIELGHVGVDSFTAIINHPKALSGGHGSLRRRWRNGAVVRPIMQLALSADHRIVGGGALLAATRAVGGRIC
jgi:hypothetical protein